MIISAARILGYVHPEQSYKVVAIDGRDAFLADLPRIRELVAEGRVCGKVRGSTLRYLELLVPLSEIASSPRIQRASSGCKAQDSQTTYRGRDELSLAYSHAFRSCASYAGSLKGYRDMIQVCA